MWYWTLAVSLILVSPLFFPEEYLELCKKILRWIRKDYERRNGWEKTMRDFGPPNEFEV